MYLLILHLVKLRHIKFVFNDDSKSLNLENSFSYNIYKFYKVFSYWIEL